MDISGLVNVGMELFHGYALCLKSMLQFALTLDQNLNVGQSHVCEAPNTKHRHLMIGYALPDVILINRSHGFALNHQ